MLERTLTIQNKLGLHARPAAEFVQLAANYNADIKLIKDGFEVNGKSILGVLMLAAENGCKITIKIDGTDEKDALKVLAGYLKGKMDQDIRTPSKRWQDIVKTLWNRIFRK